MKETVALTPETIIARIERLPVAGWHVRMRAIVASATFFDSFDALAIAFVAPSLASLWLLTPSQIGLLISSGFIGQAIGATLFGWLAERYGRLRVLTWTVAVYSLCSLACAFAWDYTSLFTLRFLEGLGLGGELPVAMAYINEFAKAERRGFFALIYQSIYPVGIIAVSLSAIWVVPTLGWQWMFVIGALPGVLVFLLRRLLPESPRWLASKGRLAEADEVLSEIEMEISDSLRRPLPPPAANVPQLRAVKASWRDLVAGIYLRRTLTVLVLGFISSFVGFGVTIWLPTIYRTVFKLPVEKSLLLSTLSNVALLLGVLTMTSIIDRVGRKPAFATMFALSAVPLLVVWNMGSDVTVASMLVLATIASYFAAQLQLGMTLYPSELYPTRIRALGSGITGISTRLGSVIGPLLVGYVLQNEGLGADFLMLATAALIAAATMLFAVESRGRLLEELSP
jgi:putative MFS transporter